MEPPAALAPPPSGEGRRASRATIVEIAALAGVSKETVSRVVNRSPLIAPETRARVERVIAELGFVPDQQVRAPALRRNCLIALIHDEGCDALLPGVIRGMQAALATSDLALCVQRLDRRERAIVRRFGDFLEYQRPTGVLLLPPLSGNDDLAGMAWEFGSRCIRLGAAREGADETGGIVSSDREAMARLIARLVALGHRRIGFVSGPDGDGAAQARELGFLDAMADAGLDRGPALIAPGDNGFASGIEAGRLLLQISPAPTAIACAGDDMAAGVLHAARGIGLPVPDALSVTGFGDASLAERLVPPLSTMRVPLAEMARMATCRLIDSERCTGMPHVYAPEMIERGTTAPPAERAVSAP